MKSNYWIKSSFSGGDGCVEIQKTGDAGSTRIVYVRDSKFPNGGVLEFTAFEWASFILGAQAGEFDLE